MAIKMSTIDAKVKDSLIRKSVSLNPEGNWFWNGTEVPANVIAGLIATDSYFRQMSSDAIIGHVESYRRFLLDSRVPTQAPTQNEEQDQSDSGAVLSGSRVVLPFELHNISHILLS